MIHVMPPFLRSPVGIIAEQFDVKPVQSARRLDVKGVLTDLFNRGDSGQRQEKPKMVREIREGTRDGFTVAEAFGLKRLAVGRKDEFGFLARRGLALPQFIKRGRYLAFGADFDVDIVALKNAAGQVGLICGSATKALDGCIFVSKRFKECEREIRRVKWRFSESRYGFFDFNGVHVSICGMPRLPRELLSLFFAMPIL
jgi:hypothetical protein